ncbi:MAG: hypothetical protein ABI454_12705 [Sphingomicrobium sp.]
MKGSSATSARARPPRPSGRSSARPRLTPTSADEYALSGPSDLPDPDYHAYRKDLADIALAGRVIASHYAQPVERIVVSPAVLRESPSDDAESLRELAPGEPFAMLDDSLGWAWGYAGKKRRVGYIRSESVRTN